MIIKRKILGNILHSLSTLNKGIVIYGSRQVGKTTLVNEILPKLGKVLAINGDSRGQWWEVLTSREIFKMQNYLKGYDAIFVDEAQRIPEIGLILKIILDNIPDLKVIATGSSSLNLASRVSEPLTGRVVTYRLYPISIGELAEFHTNHEIYSQLEERLVYGSYPEVFSREGFSSKTQYLKDLLDEYLCKDILDFGGIRNSSKVRDLLKLLAFQIGSQVSLSELGSSLGLSKDTVARYIDLLEKSYVIFRLGGFSRNLRKEVFKMDKIYFYDLGVRNAVVGNLNFLKDRDDAGKLWENFLISERMKKMEYGRGLYSHYFWRLSSGAEIDLVEEKDGKLFGYELKNSRKQDKAPKSWLTAYQGAEFSTINHDNYLDFVA